MTIPTAHGDVLVQLAQLPDGDLLVITSSYVPDVPVVRFQSSCVFGEGLRALDCDCGVQLDAAVKAICEAGGIITYAWEEGRGLGIAKKLEAIALQEAEGIDTAEAFRKLNCDPEPRTFANHVEALRLVYKGDKAVIGSRNPKKIVALENAGIKIVERVTLETPMTEQREVYLSSKIPALGHFEK